MTMSVRVLPIALVGYLLGTSAFAINERSLIVDGHGAKIQKHLHVVSIQSWTPTENSSVINRSHFCTGSIIAPGTILTAAHCAFADNRSEYVFPLEELRIVSDVADWKDHSSGKVSKVRAISGAGYQFDATHQIRDDVALIFLDECVVEPHTIKLAVPGTTKDTPCSNKATLAGWGTQSHEVRAIYGDDDYTSVLQTFNNVSLHTQQICMLEKLTYFQMKGMNASNATQELSPNSGRALGEEEEEMIAVFDMLDTPTWDRLFCLGGDDHAGLCFGDSGGPIVSDGVQIGITSFVQGACSTRPDYAMRVSFYAQWIANQVQTHDVCVPLASKDALVNEYMSEIFEEWPLKPVVRSAKDLAVFPCDHANGELHCAATSRCIPMELRCDKVVHCPSDGGMDELIGCPASNTTEELCEEPLQSKLAEATFAWRNKSIKELKTAIEADEEQRKVTVDYNANLVALCQELVDDIEIFATTSNSTTSGATMECLNGFATNLTFLDGEGEEVELGHWMAIQGACHSELDHTVMWPHKDNLIKAVQSFDECGGGTETPAVEAPTMEKGEGDSLSSSAAQVGWQSTILMVVFATMLSL